MSSIITTETERFGDWKTRLRAAAEEVLNEETEEFLRENVSEVRFDRRYRARRRRMIRHGRAELPPISKTHRFLTRAAAVLLAILTAGGVTVLGVSGLRERVVRTVWDWHEVFVRLSFLPDISADDSSPITASPSEIKHFYKPTYIPDGAEERVLYEQKNCYILEYYVNDRYLCSYEIALMSGDYFASLDSEGARITETSIHGYRAYIFQYDTDIQKANQMVWTDGNYVYYIHGHIDADTMMKMAESLR